MQGQSFPGALPRSRTLPGVPRYRAQGTLSPPLGDTLNPPLMLGLQLCLDQLWMDHPAPKLLST